MTTLPRNMPVSAQANLKLLRAVLAIILIACKGCNASCSESDTVLLTSQMLIERLQIGAEKLRPFLVFTWALDSIPLEVLSNVGMLDGSVAFPGEQPRPFVDQSLQQLLRHGVHVVLSESDAPYFESVTGRPMLFAEKTGPDEGHDSKVLDPDRARSLSNTASLFRVNRPKKSDRRFLFDDDAAEWLRNQTSDEFLNLRNLQRPSAERLQDSLSNRPHEHFIHAIEQYLTSSQLHCAYDHWNCDYVARNELFWIACQKFRLEYFQRESLNLFKFVLPSGPNSAQTLAELRENVNNVEKTNGFVQQNRDRVEVAYAHMNSVTTDFCAPVKQILYILYSLTNADIVTSLQDKSYLQRRLKEVGATVKYDAGSGAFWASVRPNWYLLLTGITLLLCSTRRGLPLLLSGVKKMVRTAGMQVYKKFRNSYTDGRSSGSTWKSIGLSQQGPRAGLRPDESPQSTYLSRFLLSRARNLSKAN